MHVNYEPTVPQKKSIGHTVARRCFSSNEAESQGRIKSGSGSKNKKESVQLEQQALTNQRRPCHAMHGINLTPCLVKNKESNRRQKRRNQDGIVARRATKSSSELFVTRAGRG
jgi:hypothetical protein